MGVSHVFVESVLASKLFITVLALVLNLEMDALDVSIQMRFVRKLKAALGARPTDLRRRRVWVIHSEFYLFCMILISPRRINTGRKGDGSTLSSYHSVPTSIFHTVNGTRFFNECTQDTQRTPHFSQNRQPPEHKRMANETLEIARNTSEMAPRKPHHIQTPPPPHCGLE